MVLVLQRRPSLKRLESVQTLYIQVGPSHYESCKVRVRESQEDASGSRGWAD